MEDKPIVNGQEPPPNGEFTRREPNYPPPPPPSAYTRQETETRPNGPVPPPPPDISSLTATVRESFVRNLTATVPDPETHYGSSGVTTFSTFGRRQHIYECPNFT